MRGKNCWNITILTKFSHFVGLLCPSHLPIRAKFSIRQQTYGLCLHAKFCLNPFIVSPSTDEKPQFWKKNFDISGVFVRSRFTDQSQIWYTVINLLSTFMCIISCWFVYYVALKRQKPTHLTILWTSAFCGVATWWRTEKAECVCTIRNLSLCNGIKTASVLQCLQGEIMHTNYTIHKHNVTSMTDTHTNKNLNFFGIPAAGEIQALPNLKITLWVT